MADFFKTFGKGVLYVVLLPFILLFLALMMVYLFISFIVMSIKSLIVFFMGGDPLGDLPVDIQARKILEERAAAQAQQINNTTTNNTTTNTNTDNSVTYNQTIIMNPSDLADFVNYQAQKNAQLGNSNPNQVGINPQQIDSQPDPLFLETTEEKGETPDELFNSNDRER